MSPEEIKEALACPEGKKWRDWDQELLVRFLTLDSAVVFRGLFPIAAASQANGPAASAAWLLYNVKPPCLISCPEAILTLLPEWDISIEEVVFYLTEQFGVPVMLATIEEMRPNITNNNELTSLDTVVYWVGCYQEMLDNRAHNEPV